MCGIILISRADKHRACVMVEKRYDAQKTRGQQGYGYIALNRGHKIESWKQATTGPVILEELRKEGGNTIMFHHRMPTSTRNVVEATHPICVSNKLLGYDYYIIHNGVITNDEDMKDKHNKMGFEYTTEMLEKVVTKKSEYVLDSCYNDSEALSIELALVIDGKQEKIEAKGSIAFICYQVDKKTNIVKHIFFGRNYSNPLTMLHNKNFLVLSSEGDGVSIEIDQLYKYDFEKDVVTKTALDIGAPRYTQNYNERTDYYSPRKPTPHPLDNNKQSYLPVIRKFDDDLEEDDIHPASFASTLPMYTPIDILLQRTETVLDIYERLNFARKSLTSAMNSNKESSIEYWQEEIEKCESAAEMLNEFDEKRELKTALDGNGYPVELPEAGD